MADREAVIRLLVNDAFEASDQSPPHAALLLVGAAMSVVMSRFSGAAAREMASMLADGMVQSISEMTGGVK